MKFNVKIIEKCKTEEFTCVALTETALKRKQIKIIDILQKFTYSVLRCVRFISRTYVLLRSSLHRFLIFLEKSL